MNKQICTKENSLVWITFLAFSFRLLILFLSENTIDSFELEAYSRINITLRWIGEGVFFPDLTFSPLYSCLVRFSQFLFRDPIWAPRVLSLIFGTLLFIPYFKLIELSFSRNIAIGSSLLLVFLPLAVRCSVVSLPAIIYSFFVVLSLYYFMLYLGHEQSGYCFASALFLGLATILRFEGVLFIPVLVLFLFFKKKGKKGVIFASISGLFFLGYLVSCFIIEGDFLLALKNSASFSYESVKAFSAGERFFLLVESFNRILTPLGFGCAVSGILLAFFRKKHYIFGLLFIVYFTVFSYKSIKGTFGPYLIRYFCLWGALLLPYILFFLNSGLYLFKRVKKKYIYLLFFMTVITCSMVAVWGEVKREKVPKETKALVSWIKKQVKETDKLLLDTAYHPYIVVETKLNYKQFYDVFWGGDRVSENTVQSLISKIKPSYIVCYRQEGGVLKKFQLEKKFSLKVAYMNNSWIVYELL